MQPPREIFLFFSKYIEDELGIIYNDENTFQLQTRLEQIAKLLGVSTIEELYVLAQSGITGAFKQLLLDVATNNETSFFRDPKVFRAIETAVFKKATQFLQPGEKLRIWSAASSTGQEALSLAILAKEFNLKNQLQLQISVLGTDISDRVREKAQTGSYTQLEVQRGLPAPYLVKYFKKDSTDQWTASSELARMLEFRKLNLKTPFFFYEKFHLILCRNVLIYQKVETKIQILERITSCLAPEGFLVLGAGESLMGLSNDYHQQSVEGAIIYQKKSAAATLPQVA